MYLQSSNAQSNSFESQVGNRWVASKPDNEENDSKFNHDDPNQPFRVVIVDRDSMSSDLLADALVRDGRCEATAIPSVDLMQALTMSSIDLLVVGAELSPKSKNGFELAEAVRRAYPDIFIVVLLNHSTHESVINAFRSGARGVFSREQPMAEFLDCVEHVRRGFIWAGRQETDSLLAAFRCIPSPSLMTANDAPALTARELQVVQHAAMGKTNKVIANDLRLSEHTVKNYLFRAFEKLGVSSRVELLFYLTLRGHTFSPVKPDELEPDLSIE